MKWLTVENVVLAIGFLLSAFIVWAYIDLPNAQAATVCQIFTGCTGTSTSPAYGKVLVGGKNGEYEFAATSTFGGGAAVSSVFGRTGVVTAQSGDYTSLQVTESGNLYFTNARAVTALTGQNVSIFTNDAGYLTQATFNTAFDNRLTATTSLPRITTLTNLSLPYSQLTGVPAFDTFGYLFPGNATSTNITFSGGLTGTLTGSITGNAATVTNGVYTTTFNGLFDNRLSASTSISGITTLPNLSLPYGQLTGKPTALSAFTNDVGYVTSSFSTTSATFWASLGFGFSTTSANYWFMQQAVNPSFSTTSAAYFSSLGLAFSTTSDLYFLSQNLGNAFSTTSSNYWLTQQTTSGLAEGSNLYFTNARADTRFVTDLAATTSVKSITTLPTLTLPYTQLSGTPATGVSSVFTRTGAVTAQSGDYTTAQVTESGNLYYTSARSLADFITNLAATTSVKSITTLASLSLPYSQLTGTPTILPFAFPGGATSSLVTFSGGLTAANNVTLSGITGSTQCLHVNSSGVVSGTGSDCGTGTGGVTNLATTYPLLTTGNTGSVTLSTAFGTTTANTYSALNTFNAGLTAYATSTIGDGTQAGGLTISGGATTTGNEYLNGNLGVGVQAPGQAIDVVGKFRAANTLSDATNKAFYFLDRNYTNSQNDFLLVFGQSKSTANTLIIGGGQTGFTAASTIAFFTGAGNNTDIGTSRLSIDSTGNVFIPSLTGGYVATGPGGNLYNVASSTSGIQSLGPLGQTQSGTTQTLATTSATTISGLTVGLTITASGNTQTFAPTFSGSISGLSTSNFASSNISQFTNDSGYLTFASSFSTTSALYFSSLGLANSTTSTNYWLTQQTTSGLAEGSNLYYTAARSLASFTSNLAATTSIKSITALPSLTLPYTQLSGAPTTLSAFTNDVGFVTSSFSTTSASYFSSLGLAFSTTSALYNFVTNLAATTSVKSITTLPSLSLPYSQLTGTPTILPYPFPGGATSTNVTFSSGITGNVTGSVTGNAGTATALAANGSNCSAGNYPLGVDASGNAENCTAANLGTLTAVTGSFPIISSGGTTPNITFGGLSTSTPAVQGNIPYFSGVNTFANVATGTISNGTGISVTAGQSIIGSGLTITNTGVTSNVAGTGIGVSGATGAVTISNTGVTSIVAGTNISISGATGAVTINCPSCGGGGSAFPFTPTTNFAINTNATSTPISFLNGFFSSSTSLQPDVENYLAIGNGTLQTNALFEIASTSTTTAQAVIRNSMIGPAGTSSADLIFENASSTNYTYYGDLGMNSAANTDSNFSGFAAQDTYLYSSDANLDFASATSTGIFGINFFTGGALAANKRFSISHTGVVTINNIGSALVLSTSGALSAYGGAAGCTNQFVTALSAVGATTCASINNAQWSGAQLTVANGGTGQTTFPTSNLLYGNGNAALSSVATSSISIGAGLVVSGGTLGYQVGGSAVTIKQIENRGFSYATTTAWTGTTTIALGVAYGEVWNTVKCFTDVGTLSVDFYHATTHFPFILSASTTIGTNNMNATADTSGDKVKVNIGTPATSPTVISCTLNDTN